MMKGACPFMTERRGTNRGKEQLTPEEWSSEQLQHQLENERREGEPIDDRKLDGPNRPST